MEYFDTLSVYDRLSHTGLPDAASRVLSEIFKDNYQQWLEYLATKKDVADIKKDIAEIKSSIDVLRLTTQRDIEQSRLATQRDIAEIQKNIAELKAIAVTRVDLRAEISESKVDLIKWVVGLMLAQSAIIITAVGVLVKLLK
ncbi:MAG: DUF1640 domain-containing protein [Deltaproteobacteria bacterium]|nr:DUF1640 domain-containing protein [Deltaproteobacteria bacterium]